MPVDLLSGQNNEREPIDLLAPTQPDAPDMPLISSKDIEERFNIIRQFAGPDIEKKARDAASIAATFNIPESTAFDMRDSFFQKMDTTNIWDKATGSFKAGWGDVYSSVGGIMKRKGLAVGDTYVDFGERLKRAYIPPSDQSEFTWRKMKDPEWYATTIMRSVPFSLSLLPAALVGAYAAGTAGGVMGLGLFGKTVLGAIGGSALARPIESSFEAQGAYEEAKDKGLSDADAEIAANQVFLDNMKLSGLDAAEFATAFLPMGKIAGNTVKRAMGKRILAATGKTSAKLGAVGAMEMMEERYQEKAVMNALGDPASLFDFDNPRLNEAGAAGAVFGVGLGGAGSVFTALRDKITASPDNKTKFIFNKAKNESLANGLSEAEADVSALDAVAATPEGKAHIEKVVGDLMDLANGKPAKESTKESTGQPFILGTSEDANGEVTGFTMADPVSGNTFEVPAIEKEGEKDNVKYTPDPEALKAEMDKINNEDIDDKIDRLIEGDDTVIEQIFGEDVPNFEPGDETTPLTPLNNAKSGESFANKLFGKAFNTLRNEDGSIVLKDNEGKDLAIVHNLSINNLRHAIKMGGLAVPSTAVINVKKSKFDSFGEITLIASKERLGPGGSQKYFNADVYSPRYPSVSYFLTENSRKSLDKWLDPLWREIPRAKNEQGGITSHYTFIEEIKEKGIDVAFEHGDALLYYAFLKESGMLPDGVDRSWDGKTKLRETVEAIGKDKYNQWYQNKIKELKLEADEKIFNGYTYAGNRRYLKHDLDTVVKLLKKELRDGEGFNYGAPSVRAKSAKQYKSIKQIKDDRHKIVSPDEMEALKEKTNDEFIALANQAIPYLKYNENSFGALDRFSEHIKEAIETHNFNRVFGENSEYYNPGVDIKAIIDYVNKLRNMPTEYFEGKIQRAVGLTEFDRAIVPDNTPDDIIQWLNSHGIKADKYINGDIESRRMAVEKAATEGNAGGTLLFTGLDITQTLDVLRGLKDNIQEAMPHLEAIGRQVYESGKTKFNEWSAAIKETLGDLWESFKDVMFQVWAKLQEERGSISTKKIPSTTDINMMLSAAARQDQATGGNVTPEIYMDLRAQAAQIAFEKIDKKLTKKQRREAARLARMGEDAARELPVFAAMAYIVNRGGLNLKSVQADYDGDTITELMKRRLGLVSKNGKLAQDEIADDFGFESGDDLINSILDWKGLKAQGKKLADDFFDYYEKALTAGEAESFREQFDKEEKKAIDQLTKKYRPRSDRGIKKEIRRRTGQAQIGDRLVTEYDALTEAFRKEANTARRAFAEGKQSEIERSKEVMRWLVKRRESLKNIRDYFGLTDAEMMRATDRRNPALMDDAEYNRFLIEVQKMAVEMADTKQAKLELMALIEDKRLRNVDNYRKALQLPQFDEMSPEDLRYFAKLLEPFHDYDVFLTQRELETVDRTDLKGIRTWREARERLAKEVGVDVEELNKVHVEALDSLRWDSSLRERDPFFDILVSRMTESILGAELRAHDIESNVYKLAKKARASRERGIVERMIPQDDLIMAFLEAPMDRKAAIVEQMTPEEINFANYIQQYFAEALNYLIATKSLERGRENYFVHVRRTFLENLKDGGLKKAIVELFKTYQQDQVVFNILDDDTGNILPLEKFFQFSLQRTEVMDPSRNVTRAFLTYVRTFEKKKMFDAIIPKLDIYAQALTPTKYTPLGLEIDRSLKRFVNKWINNKKGRRISFDSVIRQGGPLDVGIRALRTFTTMLDLGLSPIVQITSFLGEQVANAENLGTRYMAIGTARMNTDKGKRIIAKYEAFVGRSLWEDFTAPGKEVTERLSDILFSGFHVSTVLANKQFLLASLSEEEWKNEEISTERLAEMQLDMGRFRVVPGTGSLVGSTSVGDAAMQYKKWAVPIARTIIDDGEKLIRSIKEGKSLDNRTKKELIRFAYLTGAVFIVGAMAGADDTDDESYIGKFKARMYREAMTLTQGINPLLFVGVPRTWTWVKDTIKALKDLVMLEEYKTKEGLKGVGELKRQFVPGVVRSLPGVEEKE